ncbi:MAG: hypothetical protein EHM23_15255 [Acidobacteria bacterium]|nr:MAG: hypothetical protein EHM23_15255 [Acidobacteriota bacterium]
MTSTITIPALGGTAIPPEVIAQVRARVKIIHTRLGDLSVSLTGPDGAVMAFPFGPGYATRQDVDAVFGGLVNNPITNYQTLPGIAGEIQILGFVSYHGGMSVAGNWTLTITDSRHLDYGALDGWGIEFYTSPPYVTITASIPDATEVPMVSGQLTVTRAVITTQPLTVNVNFGGTAGNGIDYQPVLYTVVIPAYQASQTITITPVLFSVIRGDRTVIATLTPGSGYVVDGAGGTTSASVTIGDGPEKQVAPPQQIPLFGPWEMALMALLLAGSGVIAANWRRSRPFDFGA